MTLKETLQSLPDDEKICIGRNTAYDYCGTVKHFLHGHSWTELRRELLPLEVKSVWRQDCGDCALRILLPGEERSAFWTIAECQEYEKTQKKPWWAHEQKGKDDDKEGKN